MITTLIQHLSDTILSTEAVRHVALWNQQLTFIDEEEPFDMPAAFIELSDVVMATDVKPACLNSAKDTYRGSTTLTIHLLTQADLEPCHALPIAEDIAFALCRYSDTGEDYLYRADRPSFAITPCHDHADVVETLIRTNIKLEYTLP